MLGNTDQQANYHCEQGNTFDKGSRDDHGCLQVRTELGLTSHRLDSRATDFTDAQTSTDYCETSADSSAQVTPRVTSKLKKDIQQHLLE